MPDQSSNATSGPITTMEVADPTRPWARIHLDFAGPFLGQMFLILIDAHSKWIEVHPMTTITSMATIQKLRVTLAQLGVPETMVTDNGPSFVSEEFKLFLKKNGIAHVTSAPYHPSSNSLAERAVQISKQGLKKLKEGTLAEKIARFLFQYRITPQSTTGVSPAELLMGRRLRSRLDLIRLNSAALVEAKQQHQKEAYDRTASIRTFSEGEAVSARNFSQREVDSRTNIETYWPSVIQNSTWARTDRMATASRPDSQTLWRRTSDYVSGLSWKFPGNTFSFWWRVPQRPQHVASRDLESPNWANNHTGSGYLRGNISSGLTFPNQGRYCYASKSSATTKTPWWTMPLGKEGGDVISWTPA